ncbi:type II toxin-antitoxin system RelE/ParE family toxin [Microcoleus sp. LAD1_D3]|uniref:type II toxin-antitoxin system RelE/ParE family toxin n=1 Tax=Microcoleus sp. LAD1_D3 TaxID=2819365 RepID=UPI002FCE7D85
MNYALVFRPELREEVDEAYTWYESQQLGLGDEFLDCIDEMLDRICQMPESYPVVYRDVRRSVVRRFPYAVYYRIVSSRVIVTAIFLALQRLNSMANANLTSSLVTMLCLAVFPHLRTSFLGSARGYFSISSIDQSASNRLNSRMFVIIGSHV